MDESGLVNFGTVILPTKNKNNEDEHSSTAHVLAFQTNVAHGESESSARVNESLNSSRTVQEKSSLEAGNTHTATEGSPLLGNLAHDESGLVNIGTVQFAAPEKESENIAVRVNGSVDLSQTVQGKSSLENGNTDERHNLIDEPNRIHNKTLDPPTMNSINAARFNSTKSPEIARRGKLAASKKSSRRVRFQVARTHTKSLELSSKKRSLLRISIDRDETGVTGFENCESIVKDAIEAKLKSHKIVDELYITRKLGAKSDVPVPGRVLSHLYSLKQMTVLSLQRLQLSKIPSEFSELTHLRALCLSHNKLRMWPKALCDLHNLEKLYLDNNVLEVPPEFEIGRLSKLNFLSLSNNKLQFCPSEIAFLHNLETLYLDGNKLDKIPAQIEKLEKLSELSLDRNPIFELQGTHGLHQNVVSILQLLKSRRKKENSLAQELHAENRERREKEKAKVKIPRFATDRFDQMQYKDKYQTGALLRRAHLTHKIDLRKYGNDKFPNTLFEHTYVIEHVILDAGQICNSIINYENDGRPSIQLNPAYELLYCLKKLTTIKIYSKSRVDFLAVVNGFIRNMKLVFDLVNEHSLSPENLGSQLGWKFIVTYRVGKT